MSSRGAAPAANPLPTRASGLLRSAQLRRGWVDSWVGIVALIAGYLSMDVVQQRARAVLPGVRKRRPGLNGLLLWALVLSSGLLAACQSPPVRLMPTPVSFSNTSVDPFAHAGATLGSTEVPVFYATNRAALIEKPEPVHLTLASSDLRLGVAHVRIGDETLDWETLHRLSTSADPEERPIVQLDWLEQLATLRRNQPVEAHPDAQAFFALVNRALAASPNSELVIYVHGSNNVVPRATAQASQFRHFTGRRMVVLAFIWPSAGSLFRYLTDVANASLSVDPFAYLVELLAEHTQASRIDVLAYSAGAQIVSPALARLGTPGPGESREALRQRLRLGQIYYAAPDIDTRRFVDELGAYVDVVDRVTVSANLNDLALRFSALVGGASRAGRPNLSELSLEQSQFLLAASQKYGTDLLKVDPNDIPDLPLRSHAFWYEDPWVSGDLLGKFLLRAEPVPRGLEVEYTGDGIRYWTFPEDFGERTVQLMENLLKPEAGPAPAR